MVRIWLSARFVTTISEGIYMARKPSVGDYASLAFIGCFALLVVFVVVGEFVAAPVHRIFFANEVPYQQWREATTKALGPCEAQVKIMSSVSAGLVAGSDSVPEEVRAISKSKHAGRVCGDLWSNAGPGIWDGVSAWAGPPGPGSAPGINYLVAMWAETSDPGVSARVRDMILYKNPVGAVLTYDKAARKANARARYINRLSEKSSDGGTALKLPMWPIYYEAGAS